MSFIKAARSNEVKERFGKAIVINAKKIALFRHHGTVYALRNFCLHQGAPISDGFAKDGHAVCPHHGWSFSLDTGAFINNDKLKLKTYPVKELDGYIYIETGD
ncbi:MAG: Rieske (2Fe-2S) protein [Calditrichaceae bacterium]